MAAKTLWASKAGVIKLLTFGYQCVLGLESIKNKDDIVRKRTSTTFVGPESLWSWRKLFQDEIQNRRRTQQVEYLERDRKAS